MKYFNFLLDDIQADNLFACFEHEIENTRELIKERNYSQYPDTPYFDTHWNNFIHKVNGRIKYLEDMISDITHPKKIDGHRKSLDDLLYELRITENCVTQSVLVDCITDRLRRKNYN